MMIESTKQFGRGSCAIVLIAIAIGLFAARAAHAQPLYPNEDRITPRAALTENVVEYGVDFGRWPYPLHAEVNEELRQLARRYPQLARVHHIGNTRRGRELLVLEIANRQTGPPESKPAVWMDGNIHAGEITGRPYLRYFANRLLSSYGSDAQATRLVDRNTFYVMPVFDADGGEVILTRHPSWPGHDADEQPGDDLDGDGFITALRKADPNLPGGYRYYSEARDLQEDAFATSVFAAEWMAYSEIPFLRRRTRDRLTGEREGADFNRNWSAEWDPLQPGAGPYPFSLPEVKAVAEFIATHQNIYFAYSIHSGGGGRSYMVRPPMNQPYEWMPPEDNDFYVRAGGVWADLSDGGITENNYYSFLFTTGVLDEEGGQVGYGKGTFVGFMDDWVYMQQGIHSLTPEVNGAAPDYNGDKWIRSDERIRWAKETGRFFKEWESFEHPVLGTVEIGGPRAIPPALDATMRHHCEIQYEYLLYFAELAPDLRVGDVTAETLDDGNVRVRATIENHGWLSTYVTRQAIRINRDLPALAELNVTGGAVIDGLATRQVGHVRGKLAYIGNYDDSAIQGDSQQRVEWLVKPESSPMQITVDAWAPRAGRDQKTISVP